MDDFVIEKGILRKYTGPGGKVVIPDGITEIGFGAFGHCKTLTEVMIPEGVTRIDVFAFLQCTALTAVTVPQSLRTVGDCAFDGCEQLYELTLPAEVTSFNSWFASGILTAPGVSVEKLRKYNCQVPGMLGFLRNRPAFTDPRIIEGYEKYLLARRKWVLSTAFTRDVVEAVIYYGEKGRITPKNFEQDYLLPAQNANAMNCVAWLLNWRNENITPEAMEKEQQRLWNKDPFNTEDMKRLWNFTPLPDGTLCIERYKGVEPDVFIPERIGRRRVTRIGDQAFYWGKSGRSRENRTACIQMQSITLPDSITEIGPSAFERCRSLTELELPQGVTVMAKDVLYGCISLTSVTLPQGLTRIEEGAFYGCRMLSQLTVPQGVTQIDQNAFFDCEQLQYISLPESVTEIHEKAFVFCTKLTIGGRPGSYAEQYAKEHGIPFVPE